MFRQGTGKWTLVERKLDVIRWINIVQFSIHVEEKVPSQSLNLEVSYSCLTLHAFNETSVLPILCPKQ